MLNISQITMSPEGVKNKSIEEILALLKEKAAKLIGCLLDEITDIKLLKRSVDARKKPAVVWSYSVAVSLSNEKKYKRALKNPRITPYNEKRFKPGPPHILSDNTKRPVVVGFGPAGIAAAFVLAKWGLRPLIIERGSRVDERLKAVERFWNTGKLSEKTNVQFGEGGAGAFSDGKLSTGKNDKDGLQRSILEALCEHGAPREILYDPKPHLGTDLLTGVVKNFREDIISLGGEFLFDTRMESLEFDGSDGERHIRGVHVDGPRGREFIEATNVFLAIGHSARDTFVYLSEEGVSLTPKPFAVGYRVIHPQDVISRNQYGEGYKEKALPTADYKLTRRVDSGRPVFSFCMCPGGYVVNASSIEGALCVNGMSYSRRDGDFANSAIALGITPEELPRLIDESSEKEPFGYEKEDPLLGMYFQEILEKRAYHIGQGRIPYCHIGDAEPFGTEDIKESAFRGDVTLVPDLLENNLILPPTLNRDFKEAMKAFSNTIEGFESALVAGVESRTSSPVRIVRTDTFDALGIKGLLPCGEGAGYAGGIMSAAMDGVRAALALYTTSGKSAC